MSMALSTQTIEELWQGFKTSNPSGRDEVTVEGLRNVMQSLGHQPSDEELRQHERSTHPMRDPLVNHSLV